MSSTDFDKMVAECRKCIKSRRVIGDDPSPRFESFHAPSSICSEKVRCVLLFKGRVGEYLRYSIGDTQRYNNFKYL